MADQLPEPNTDKRKAYEKPQILHELPLEIRAGSPITGGFDPLNPLDLGK